MRIKLHNIIDYIIAYEIMDIELVNIKIKRIWTILNKHNSY